MGEGFRVGVGFPQTEIGADFAVIRDFAQAVEDMGYSHLTAYDHIVGADRSVRPEWQGLYDLDDMFHEPLTLFSYLAGVTTTLGLMPAIIPLPQRQAVLFAKQAATLDVLSGGRLTLGVGLGWNDIEYQALGVDFARRVPIFEEQIDLLRRLWTDPNVAAAGQFHTLASVGLNPLPVQRPIPLYIGAIVPAAIRRAARLGDGWISTVDGDQAEEAVGMFRDLVTECGRDPRAVKVVSDTHLGTTIGGAVRTADDALRATEQWRRAGAAGTAFDTTNMGLTSIDQHLDLLRRIADGLGLAKG